MPHYSPPLRDLRFVYEELLDVPGQLRELPAFAEIDPDLIKQILEEGGRFCADVLQPLNQRGDEQGCRLQPDGTVRTPDGFKDAWDQFTGNGWSGLTASAEYGGQGLPAVLAFTLQEMMNASNQAWSMYPGLTHGAAECLAAHGTPEQKALYLKKFADGAWTGTMCLTEAHCGTDLGLLRTRAQPQPDGSYRLDGTKIFISSGEHDLSANIVHLVLARLPDAPPGTKGISLFIVPKYIPDADGEPGERNGIRCARLEEKMGIHGNATCEMQIENATGWLVGEPNRGLQAMFVMMNSARLGVGCQGLGLTEVSYQNALAYAKDRLQSRSVTGPKSPDTPADPIIVHPDVRRMLLTQKAWAEGGRAFATWLALQLDVAHNHPDETARSEAADLLALLTPVCKAFLTDNGSQAANLGVQVYGGHGYVREWGVEQFVRDSRINAIYEGTNGIQALDLLGRKVLGDGGAKLRLFGRRITAFIEEHGHREEMAEFVNPLADLAGKVEKLSMEIGFKAMSNPDEAAAAAVDYLRVVGHLVFAWFFARSAAVALARAADGDEFHKAKLATARFYFAKLLPETAALIRSARSGSAVLMDVELQWF